MFIILSYDIGTKRNHKILKICRRYLFHIQKSVFEGYLKEIQLESLKESIRKVVNPKEDQVVIYKYHFGRIEKDIIGNYNYNMLSNIL